MHAFVLSGALVGLATFAAVRRGVLLDPVGVWQRVLSVAWRVALMVNVAELLVTVAGLGTYAPVSPPPDSEVPWRVAWRICDAEVREDLVRPRSERPLLAFVGDSFVAGIGSPKGQTLPEQTARALESRGIDVDARNLGTSGHEFAQEVGWYVPYGSSLDPDVVVWVFVLNDFGLSVRDSSWDFINDRRDADPTGLRVLDATLHVIGQRYAAARTEAAYHDALAAEDAHWASAGTMLASLVAERKKAGGRFLFVIYPLMYQLTDYPFAEEHRRLAAWATAAGAEVLDLAPAFAGRDAGALHASATDQHPNPNGHAIAANAIRDALVSAPLVRARRTDCVALPVDPEIRDVTIAACTQRDAASTLALEQRRAELRRWILVKPWRDDAIPDLTADGALLAAWRARAAGDELHVRQALALLGDVSGSGASCASDAQVSRDAQSPSSQ